MYPKKELEYSYDALEPYIDTKTVEIHYNRHYQNYLNKLNSLLKEANYNFNYTKEELVSHIDLFDLNLRGDILYNLGGVLNHELYFSNMSDKKNIFPVGKLKTAIDKQFGSFENFKNDFIKTADLMVGSGYTFLVINSKKELEIINFSNQETPYYYGLIPIIALDLWEHAYYLKYLNKRHDYIVNFFNVIDFDKVNKLYEKNI